MIKQIANIIEAWNQGLMSCDEAGELFANLLSENTGLSCVNTAIKVMRRIQNVYEPTNFANS